MLHALTICDLCCLFGRSAYWWGQMQAGRRVIWELMLVGWVWKPQYKGNCHHLTWGRKSFTMAPKKFSGWSQIYSDTVLHRKMYYHWQRLWPLWQRCLSEGGFCWLLARTLKLMLGFTTPRCTIDQSGKPPPSPSQSPSTSTPIFTASTKQLKSIYPQTCTTQPSSLPIKTPPKTPLWHQHFDCKCQQRTWPLCCYLHAMCSMPSRTWKMTPHTITLHLKKPQQRQNAVPNALKNGAKLMLASHPQASVIAHSHM